MKKLKTLFKASPVVAIIAGLLLVGVASAALVGVYVTITGTAEIEQAVVSSLEGEVLVDVIAGNTFIQNADLENKANVVAPVEFVTIYSPDGEGIDTSYWSKVVLEDKDSSWDIILNDISVTLTYELASSTFNYELEGKVAQVGTEYSLIYYADKPDRFNEWGGNNPGVLIAIVTSDDAGNISVEGSTDIGMTLPSPNDANIDEYNYCELVENGGTGDMYELCHGAKVWLVPSTDYVEPALTAWSPATYLFDTELITYGNENVLNLGKGTLDFFVKNVFAVGMEEGAYTIKTEIRPVH